MPFLAAIPLDLGNGHTLDSYPVKGLFNVVKLKRLDYGLDLFHFDSSFR